MKQIPRLPRKISQTKTIHEVYKCKKICVSAPNDEHENNSKNITTN